MSLLVLLSFNNVSVLSNNTDDLSYLEFKVNEENTSVIN